MDKAKSGSIKFFCACGKEIWQSADLRNALDLIKYNGLTNIECSDCLMDRVLKRQEEPKV